MFSYSKVAEINAPIQRVYGVLVDWKNYRRLCPPELKKIKVISAADESAEINFVVKYLMTVDYVMLYKLVPGHSVRWRLSEEGSVLKKNSGSVELESHGRNMTKAVIRARIEFGFFVPTVLFENKLKESSVIMLDNLKKLSEKK
jgi:hypothetical protein